MSETNEPDLEAQVRAEIRAKIDEGYEQAKRGELLDAEEVRGRTRALIQELSKAGR